MVVDGRWNVDHRVGPGWTFCGILRKCARTNNSPTITANIHPGSEHIYSCEYVIVCTLLSTPISVRPCDRCDAVSAVTAAAAAAEASMHRAMVFERLLNTKNQHDTTSDSLTALALFHGSFSRR